MDFNYGEFAIIAGHHGGDINAERVAKTHKADYISLTDMAKRFGADTIIYNWIRNRNIIEFIGINVPHIRRDEPFFEEWRVNKNEETRRKEGYATPRAGAELNKKTIFTLAICINIW